MKQRHLQVMTTLLLAGMTLAGCASSTMLGGSGGGSKSADSAGNAKDEKTDPTRPTDSGEGLPGYLTDPAGITISREDGNLTVVAPAGAVANDSGKPEATRIYVFQVSWMELGRMLDSVEPTVTLHGTLRGALTPASNGALSGSVVYPEDEPALLVSEPTTKTDEVTLHPIPGDAKWSMAAYKYLESDKPTAGYQEPSLLWTTAQYQEVFTAILPLEVQAEKEKTAAESASFVHCQLKALSSRYPFAQFEANQDAAFQAIYDDGTEPNCMRSVLAERSDQATARLKVNKWTKRQVDWNAKGCTKTAPADQLAARGPAGVLAACVCQYEAVSAKIEILDWFKKSDADAQALMSADPDVLACSAN